MIKKIILFILCLFVFSAPVMAQDIDAARKLMYHAKKGEQKAQYNLGLIYYEGKLVKQDYEKAFYWFTKSAEQHNDKAQYNLGVMYANGQGVQKNFKNAYYWFFKAAKKGNTDAKYNLGVMYSSGQGVEKNNAAAISMYVDASRAGHIQAPYNIAVLFFNGRDLKKDNIQAYAWASLAEKRGLLQARDIKLRIQQEMTEEDLIKAEELAKKYSLPPKKLKKTPTNKQSKAQKESQQK